MMTAASLMPYIIQPPPDGAKCQTMAVTRPNVQQRIARNCPCRTCPDRDGCRVECRAFRAYVGEY